MLEALKIVNSVSTPTAVEISAERTRDASLADVVAPCADI